MAESAVTPSTPSTTQPQPSTGKAFAALTLEVERMGLLKPQPGYYAFTILSTLALLGLGMYFLVVLDSLWLQLLNAVYMAFVFTRMAFIGHDAGHRVIFRSNGWSEATGHIISFLMGMNRSWWVDKHSRHHADPNHLDQDPDTFIPVLAFTEEQARSKRGLFRLTAKYQAYLFLPILSLQGIGLRLAGVQFLLSHKVQHPKAEWSILAAHSIVYFGLLFYLLDPLTAVLFAVVHQMLFGLYMGLSFAPNHKGMPILKSGTQMDYVRQQVITARNINAHPVNDFLYGGLNYQIEHHLFPNMPRNQLKKSQGAVKEFCGANSISYHEVSAFRSLVELETYLHRIAAAVP